MDKVGNPCVAKLPTLGVPVDKSTRSSALRGGGGWLPAWCEPREAPCAQRRLEQLPRRTVPGCRNFLRSVTSRPQVSWTHSD